MHPHNAKEHLSSPAAAGVREKRRRRVLCAALHRCRGPASGRDPHGQRVQEDPCGGSRAALAA